MNWARVFIGSLIIAVGAIWLADYAGLLDAGDFIATWWPVTLIAAGVLSVIANPRQWLFPGILIIAGVAFLLDTTDVMDATDLIWPAALILVGLLIVFGRGFGSGTESTGDEVRSFNIFSGSELASHSKAFKGGNVGAVFGGSEIDLRDAHPAPGAVLDIFVMFGGVEVKVPQGWRVQTQGFPIFGGVENATAKDALPEDAPLLIVSTTVLFGGLEIKH